MLSAIAKGITKIKPFILSADAKATLDCIKKLGVAAKIKAKNVLTVKGEGLLFPRKDNVTLFAKESGTTIRILSGLLCGQKFTTKFDASPALKKRPMKRITAPLRMMGANIKGRKLRTQEYPPLMIGPAKRILNLKYKLPVASAQVKSCLLLASLYAKGITKIIEPTASRDHTERMLKVFKARISKAGRAISLGASKALISPRNIFIPGDFSSAAFFIILGLILKKSQLLIKNVNINPTRCGLLNVLKRMNAKIKVINKKNYYEPYADILVKSSTLCATKVKENEIPTMIDEIPILCVAASFAKGTTKIKGLKELKVKESDRLNAIIHNLKKAKMEVGAHQYKTKKGKNWAIVIKGSRPNPAAFKSFNDHRIAMSMIVLGLALSDKSKVDDIKCIDKSFPEFISLIKSL